MKKIRLQIKKRITHEDDHGYSFESEVYINDHKLGHGVTGINLDMKAGKRPKLTIECVPDEMDVDLPIQLIRLKDAHEKDHK